MKSIVQDLLRRYLNVETQFQHGLCERCTCYLTDHSAFENTLNSFFSYHIVSLYASFQHHVPSTSALCYCCRILPDYFAPFLFSSYCKLALEVTFPVTMLCKLTFTRDSIYVIARICYRRSVRLSVRRVDYRKTVEVRIMNFLPYGSPPL